VDGRWLPQQNVPAALRGVAHKLDRAERHLDEIAATTERTLQGFKVAVTPRPRQGNRVPYRLQDAPTLPPALSVMFGDALHNMRSALDHLAWQLVLRDGGQPTQQTQFPLQLHRRSDGGFPEIRGGVAAATRQLLDEVQRYADDDLGADPRLHPLAVLKTLSNIDKHRELLLGVAVVSGGSWSCDVGVAASFERGPHRSVRNGDDLGVLVVDPADAEIHDLELDFALRLVEGSEAGFYARFDLVDWALHHAMTAVEYRVLRRFLPLFTESAGP